MGNERPKQYGINKLRETWVVKESVRRSMQANRSTETEPERILRSALWDAGLRGYRKNVRRLPGSPDIVFGPLKLAVFVHGCYWHRCAKCTRNIHPKTNSKYWKAKFDGNVARDKRNRATLKKMGYTVIVAWECEVRKNVDRVVRKVEKALRESDS
ncbi:MAG: very short patch repair endonuclease [Armatimonadetes bacterium]|nr:very short patch repair endonuclease [Armatimonadota bacterium]